MDNIQKKAYRNLNWITFSEKVKSRDFFSCVKCNRNEKQATLQVHHKLYKHGLLPWEYGLSDCITLCKGCHAEVHGKVEPRFGWTLIGVSDLGDMSGFCERQGCGHEIRYENEIYHPDFGYKIVGSSCVEYLTNEDKWLSNELLKIYKKISKFIHESEWFSGVTKNGKSYIYTIHKHNQIRIYGNELNYSFQLAIKCYGQKWFDWRIPIRANGKPLIQVKEMAYIVLKGTISNSDDEINLLRNIYTSIL